MTQAGAHALERIDHFEPHADATQLFIQRPDLLISDSSSFGRLARVTRQCNTLTLAAG